MSEEISETKEDSNLAEENENSSSNDDSDSSVYYDYDYTSSFIENTAEEQEPVPIIDVTKTLDVISQSDVIKANLFIYIFASFVLVLR